MDPVLKDYKFLYQLWNYLQIWKGKGKVSKGKKQLRLSWSGSRWREYTITQRTKYSMGKGKVSDGVDNNCSPWCIQRLTWEMENLSVWSSTSQYSRHRIVGFHYSTPKMPGVLKLNVHWLLVRNLSVSSERNHNKIKKKWMTFVFWCT